VTGTLGILRIAAERGLIDVPEVLARLRDTSFYVAEDLIWSIFGRWLDEGIK
jgi:predicted nucleic acid-binding protein